MYYSLKYSSATSLISSSTGLSSSRLCLDDMEKTRMKALPRKSMWLVSVKAVLQPPLDTESLCMAGNWWLPAVSVICMVHTALLLLITFLREHSQLLVLQDKTITIQEQNKESNSKILRNTGNLRLEASYSHGRSTMQCLLVRIFDCWCVGLRKCSLDKSVHQTCLSHSWREFINTIWTQPSCLTSCSKDDDSVVVT